MITCSKCGELLEDGAEVCYLCKHHLTRSEREKADRISEEYKPILAALKEYKKRTKRGMISIGVSIVLLLVMAYVFVSVEVPMGVQSACFILWFVEFIGGFVWSKINRCPWCGWYQLKHPIYRADGMYCRHCGKILVTYEAGWDKEQDQI